MKPDLHRGGEGVETIKVPWLYEAEVGHSRRSPVRNDFTYRSYMWLFDLSRPPELPRMLQPFARYRERDHLDVKAQLLDEGIEVSRLVVLTNLAVAGYVFNPISVYWAYRADGSLSARVAEVHNTYGQRHCYVLEVDDSSTNVAQVKKEMTVSPFYPVDGSYRIAVSDPGEHLNVSVTLEREGEPAFRAWMSARRIPASGANLARLVVRYPLAPLRTRALIQWQGIKLWTKGVSVLHNGEAASK